MVFEPLGARLAAKPDKRHLEDERNGVRSDSEAITNNPSAWATQQRQGRASDETGGLTLVPGRSASERQWYCIRGDRPMSPSTSTAT